jgi:predicted 3-demethylubiquinone-9 3-methyltransferase (glyoxalase superfamily)
MRVAPTISPFLWFDDQAEAAAELSELQRAYAA